MPLGLGLGLSRNRQLKAVPVTTLPADASTYGPRVLYYKYPVVSSLPATVVDDARYVLDATKVEYLGRSVVHLSGSDNLQLPLIQINQGDFEHTFHVNDIDVGVVSYPSIFSSYEGETAKVNLFCLNGSQTVQGFFTGVNGHQINSVLPVLDGTFHSVSIGLSGTTGYIKVDGIITNTCDLTAWIADNQDTVITSSKIFDDVSVSPLQVCCIQQSLNGVLIDSIPCDESTGTTLRNTVSPDRPATLSDATAHALAWVAQPIATLGLWVWDGDEWVQS